MILRGGNHWKLRLSVCGLPFVAVGYNVSRALTMSFSISCIARRVTRIVSYEKLHFSFFKAYARLAMLLLLKGSLLGDVLSACSI